MKFGLLFRWFLDIRLDIKVCEQSEKECSKEKEEGHVNLGVVAVHEEGCAGMDAPGDELDQLHAKTLKHWKWAILSTIHFYSEWVTVFTDNFPDLKIY